MAGGPHTVTAAAVVRSTGFSIKALLHLARGRRIQAEPPRSSAACRPSSSAPEPARTTTLIVPSSSDPYQALPADLVERLAHRTDIELVLTPGP